MQELAGIEKDILDYSSEIEALEENKLQVQDRSGKLWWIGYSQVSASFL